MANQLGLGRKPKAQVAPAATRAAPVSADADPKTRAKPTRSRGTRSAAKSEAVTEAAGASAPPRGKPSPSPASSPYAGPGPTTTAGALSRTQFGALGIQGH